MSVSSAAADGPLPVPTGSPAGPVRPPATPGGGPAPSGTESASFDHIIPSPLRPDLVINKQTFKNEVYFVIKDPLAMTYFRLKPEEALILSFLDGKRNLNEVTRRFHAAHPERELSPREIAGFIQQLGAAGLLNVNARRFVEFSQRRAQGADRFFAAWAKAAATLVYFKVPILRPGDWLTRLSASLAFVWTRPFIYGCFALMAWTGALLLFNRDAFAQNSLNFFAPDNLILLWICVLVLKTIHEFAHATTCRHYGGEVTEMGVSFFCLSPFGYCDASDAWMMPRHSHKIYTTAAGIFSEFIVACVAAHLWLFAPEGLLKNLAFNMMIIASVNALFFNLNPLMKFDGYYILSDLLQIPNLRTKSISFVSHRLQLLLCGVRNLHQEKIFEDEAESRVFVVYAVVAYAYMFVIMYSLSQVFPYLLAPYGLRDLGLSLGAFLLSSYTLLPMAKFVYDGVNPRTRSLRERVVPLPRVLWTRGLVVLALLALLFWPSRFRVEQQGVVLFENSEQVAARTGGVIESIYVRTGDRVEAGQPIVRLSNPQLERQLALARADVDRARLVFGALQTSTNPASTQQLAQAATALESADLTLRKLEEDVAGLTLRAGIAGQVVGPELHRLLGIFVPPGTSIARIADRGGLRLVVPLREEETRLVAVGSEVRGRWEANGEAFATTLRLLPKQRAHSGDYLPGFFALFGGPAPTDPSMGTGVDPNVAFFLAEAELPQPTEVSEVHEHMRARVTIYGARSTLGGRIWWNLANFWNAKLRSI